MTRAALTRLLLAAWFVAPLAALGLWAVADRWSAGTPLPDDWGPRGWSGASAAGVAAALWRSALLANAVTLLATPAGAMAARGLLRVGPRLRAVAAALLLLPAVVPPLTVVLGLDVLLLRLQVPAAVGVVSILVVQALPYTAYVMYITYLAHDDTYEDEARTLGASPFRTLVRVQLPLVAPGLAAAAFLALLVAWSDYVVTVIVGGGLLVTLPVLVASAAAGTGNEPVVAVMSLLAALPPLGLLVALGMLGRRGRAGSRSGVTSRRASPVVTGARP